MSQMNPLNLKGRSVIVERDGLQPDGETSVPVGTRGTITNVTDEGENGSPVLYIVWDNWNDGDTSPYDTDPQELAASGHIKLVPAN